MLSTQYARNGPLVPESRSFVRLVALGCSRAERRHRLVVQNELGRPSTKARRNLFEALESRFGDERRARDLGILSYSSVAPRTLLLALLSELVAHDELVAQYLYFISERVGEEIGFVDARLFIAKLATTSTPVAGWAPSLQRRAVTALNSLPVHFGLWQSARPAIVQRPQLPLEMFGLLFFWQLERNESVFNAPFLKTLALRKCDMLEALWACARRGWFEVEAAGDVVNARLEFYDVGTLFGVDQKLLAAAAL